MNRNIKKLRAGCLALELVAGGGLCAAEYLLAPLPIMAALLAIFAVAAVAAVAVAGGAE